LNVVTNANALFAAPCLDQSTEEHLLYLPNFGHVDTSCKHQELVDILIISLMSSQYNVAVLKFQSEGRGMFSLPGYQLGNGMFSGIIPQYVQVSCRVLCLTQTPLMFSRNGYVAICRNTQAENYTVVYSYVWLHHVWIFLYHIPKHDACCSFLATDKLLLRSFIYLRTFHQLRSVLNGRMIMNGEFIMTSDTWMQFNEIWGGKVETERTKRVTQSSREFTCEP